jgi:hypothetical protein
LWRPVVLKVVTNVSEEVIAFIFRVMHCGQNPKDRNTNFHPARKPQTSHSSVCEYRPRTFSKYTTILLQVCCACLFRTDGILDSGQTQVVIENKDLSK